MNNELCLLKIHNLIQLGLCFSTYFSSSWWLLLNFLFSFQYTFRLLRYTWFMENSPILKTKKLNLCIWYNMKINCLDKIFQFLVYHQIINSSMLYKNGCPYKKCVVLYCISNWTHVLSVFSLIWFYEKSNNITFCLETKKVL